MHCLSLWCIFRRALLLALFCPRPQCACGGVFRGKGQYLMLAGISSQIGDLEGVIVKPLN